MPPSSRANGTSGQPKNFGQKNMVTMSMQADLKPEDLTEERSISHPMVIHV